jgi:hypothetical protein
MTERSRCIVPFCKNSSAKWSGNDYICGPHWKLVPRKLKRIRSRLMNRFLKSGDLVVRDGKWYAMSRRANVIGHASWRKLCEAAKKGATGL